MIARTDAAEPIFILGIMPRSGTNFLWDLLLLHPDCGAARAPVREDFFVEHSGHLSKFAAAVRDSWDPMWGRFDADITDRLLECLGEGLISFLWTERERRLVTKSPSVKNLEQFFTIFPRSKLLILIRDGRSVVQSCMATFGWDFDTAARRWASAVDEVVSFKESAGHPENRYLIVRYEDLVDDVSGNIRRVLEFAGLDPATFDFEAAENLPVRGSSTFFGPEHAAVHWGPVERDESFRPKQRWESWDERTRRRFEWLAGRRLRLLGYDDAEPPSSGNAIVNRLADAAWHTRRAGNIAVYRARGVLGNATRPLRQKLGIARHR